MPNNWNTYKLADALEIKYGKDHKKVLDGNIPIYGTGGIMRYGNQALYDKETILIPRKGSLNNIFYLNEPFWSVDTIFWSKINNEVAFPKYLFYNLKVLDFASMDVGSAIPSLTTELLKKIEIKLPPIEEQQAIASILSAIDDKIENNLAINKTLEEMAMALYKHWFVDFGPFQNDEFVESELGMIPEGFKVKKLGDFVKHKKGYAFKSQWYQETGQIIVRVSDTTENSIDFKSCHRIPNELAINYEDHLLKTNDVVIATVGSWPPNYSSVVGKVIRVPKITENALLNQNAVILNMFINNKIQQGLLYYTLKNERFLNYIVNCAQGSASQASIKLTDIFNYPIPFDSNSQFEDFHLQIEDFLDQQNSLIEENQTLTQLRDTSLPKLISGEIHLKEFKKEVSTLL